MWVRFWRRLGAVFLVLATLVAAHPALAQSTTTVTTSPSQTVGNQSFTITATVTGSWVSGDDVVFSIDGVGNIGTVDLDGDGLATYSTSLPAGTYTVRAAYFDGHTGDGTDSSSGSTQHVVTKASTTTSVTASSALSEVGQPVTFTATVAAVAPGAGTPSGRVTFLDGTTPLGPAILLNGSAQATFTTSTLSVGEHAITVAYNGGNSSFLGGTSDELLHTVVSQSTVTIAVTTDGADATFGFTSPNPALAVSVASSGGSGSSAAITLPADTYSISAPNMTGVGFALSSIACDDGNSTGDAGTGSATIKLGLGENVTCTFAFTNSRDAATDLIEDFFETRAELILSHGPNRQRRVDRLNSIAPSSSDPASALMGLMPLVSGGGPRTLSGSLGAIEQAVADPAEPAAFDIWFETTFGAYGSDAAQGNFGIAYLGADYLVSSDLLVGALFQLDRVGFDSNTGDATAEGTGWMIGPYVTGRLGDNLYVDLRAAAGRSTNSLSPYGTYTDEVDASRWLIEANISGEWTDGSWTFQPAARLSYFEETSDAYTDGLGIFVPSVTTGTGQLALGPALSYRFVTDGEIGVVIGARLDGVLDFTLDGGSLASDGAHAELEASIDLGLPGGARLGAAVKAGGLGEDNFRFLSGTVSVSAAIQ
jgi:hypothetical protein